MKKYALFYFLFLFFLSVAGQQFQLTPQQFSSVKKAVPSKPVTGRPVITPPVTNDHYYKVERRNDFLYFKFNHQNRITSNRFFELSHEELGLGSGSELKLLRTDIDATGISHSRFDQYYFLIPVVGCQLIIHHKQDTVISANGLIAPVTYWNRNPVLTASDAIGKAINYFGAEKYSWQLHGFEKKPGDAVAASAFGYPVPRLVYMFEPGNDGHKQFQLCYEVLLESVQPFGGYAIYVNALDGTEVNRISQYHNNTDVPATANTLYSGVRNITVDSYAGGYRLRENNRPIQTMDLNNNYVYHSSYLTDFTNPTTTWNTPEFYIDSMILNTVNPNWTDGGQENPLNGEFPDIFTWYYDNNGNLNDVFFPYYDHSLPDTIYFHLVQRFPNYSFAIWDDDFWTNPNDSLGAFSFTRSSSDVSFSGAGNSGMLYRSSTDNPAHDAHWGTELSYDFYKNIFNRNSYNDSGAVIKSCVHFSVGLNNAYWSNQYKVLLFGDGDGVEFSPMTSLDIVGHELTHGVISTSSNLVYQGQSGALNESFADIFGTCIEFYSGVSPDWLLSEDCYLKPPYYLRSMSNPNSASLPQPDTYRGTYWYPPNQNWDNGGVHVNSGVQNFWFYLLVNGGTGTNDIGNSYNVNPISLADARAIAYQNMVYYLVPGSDYFDAYYNSLAAADQLFGGGSPQVASVRAAWWAVGIGNDPNLYCSGLTWYAWPFYQFADGSGRDDYMNNSNCTWLLAPFGADSLTLVFTSFDTEAIYDSVIVYDGPDDSYPIVTIWWGNTVPPPITSTYGALFVKFVTDGSIVSDGWTAYYVGYGQPSCFGITTVTTATGNFEDGSGTSNYANNLLCGWLLAPPCANSVTLNFTSFSTEANYDFVYVYDGNWITAPLLYSGSGSTIPPAITSTQGEMLVVFVTDQSVKYPGWAASYSSSGAPICTGTSSFTFDSGLISDGSGSSNYCNNIACSWLIQPTGASNVILNFTYFDLEPISENETYADYVEVFDGPDTTATRIGKFAGNIVPPTIVSTGNSLFVRFVTNYSLTFQGFEAVYYSITPVYCPSTSVLTAPSGTFSDGSGPQLYGNNTFCDWLIQPPGALRIYLGFTNFDTESYFDIVEVYDGTNSQAPLIASFDGSAIPALTASTGGAMLVRFYSDISVRRNGWDAFYTSSMVNTKEIETTGLTIFPNPAMNYFSINSEKEWEYNSVVQLMDATLRVVKEYRVSETNPGLKTFSLRNINQGMYFVCKKFPDESNENNKIIGKLLVIGAID